MTKIALAAQQKGNERIESTIKDNCMPDFRDADVGLAQERSDDKHHKVY